MSSTQIKGRHGATLLSPMELGGPCYIPWGRGPLVEGRTCLVEIQEHLLEEGLWTKTWMQNRANGVFQWEQGTFEGWETRVQTNLSPCISRGGT